MGLFERTLANVCQTLISAVDAGIFSKDDIHGKILLDHSTSYYDEKFTKTGFLNQANYVNS